MMKKILCLLVVLTLFVFTLSAQSSVVRVDESAKEEVVISDAYIGKWIISDDSITEKVTNELIKEGINKNSDLFSFYLSDGVEALKSELPDILLTLESDNKGKYAVKYALEGYEIDITYQVAEDKRLFFTAKTPWDLYEEEKTVFFGTFNDDYSKLYADEVDGIYFMKKTE